MLCLWMQSLFYLLLIIQGVELLNHCYRIWTSRSMCYLARKKIMPSFCKANKHIVFKLQEINFVHVIQGLIVAVVYGIQRSCLDSKEPENCRGSLIQTRFSVTTQCNILAFTQTINNFADEEASDASKQPYLPKLSWFNFKYRCC